jgi:hypothetical protein
LCAFCYGESRLTEARWQLRSESLEEDTRMTTEQLKELVEVISVLTAKSSVLKERDELHGLIEENQRATSEEAEVLLSFMFRIPTDSYPTNRTPKRRHF